MTEETKRKIGQANSPLMKKLWKDPEYRKRQSNAHKGKPSPMKGKSFSEESKRKLSETLKKQYQTGERIPPWLGKKRQPFSEESKRKMSKALEGRFVSKETREKIGKANRGEKSGNWKGGITPENKRVRNTIEFRLWRESVFARDNWTCQKYGIRGGKLNPHHIKNFADYPELRFAIDNGITLSERAHKEFHKKYGQRNNTKEQLEEFLYAITD